MYILTVFECVDMLSSKISKCRSNQFVWKGLLECFWEAYNSFVEGKIDDLFLKSTILAEYLNEVHCTSSAEIMVRGEIKIPDQIIFELFWWDDQADASCRLEDVLPHDLRIAMENVFVSLTRCLMLSSRMNTFFLKPLIQEVTQLVITCEDVALRRLR